MVYFIGVYGKSALCPCTIRGYTQILQISLCHVAMSIYLCVTIELFTPNKHYMTIINHVYVLQNDSGGYYRSSPQQPYADHGIHYTPEHGCTHNHEYATVFSTEEEAQAVLDEAFEEYSDFAFFICRYNSKEEFHTAQIEGGDSDIDWSIL